MQDDIHLSIIDRIAIELAFCNHAGLTPHDAAKRVLRVAYDNPPKHNFWGAGEADCPSDIKVSNGELHTMQCKVCGAKNPRSGSICHA